MISIRVHLKSKRQIFSSEYILGINVATLRRMSILVFDMLCIKKGTIQFFMTKRHKLLKFGTYLTLVSQTKFQYVTRSKLIALHTES